ncbi:Imidazole glycerol phosphate synthase subunit HisH [Eubacterium plexicaudatum ASF492]|uniref:Imidazole glycerol phosphate synthase subunit HisH n=1 Tax=Eubacterium plexicaudatum ASF492 TaxID=1235802 RepID=N2ACX7_9FIRM|nr:Imidazole glycerol phosphate synthase subunit HisH [Eubacterium plexicaudatum ASF492]
MVAIIDYDAGNLMSVQKAFQKLGEEAVVTREFQTILRADRIVLPGVGSFGVAMRQLKKYELDRVIREAVERGIPFLGICLGLQLLFDGSDESEGVEGLGILRGRIVKIPEADGLKIPHIGWNSLTMHNGGRLFRGMKDGSYVYFVHSYYLQAEDERIVRATTEYGVTIHASVESQNVFACQFHPEKSSTTGLGILSNFVALER